MITPWSAYPLVSPTVRTGVSLTRARIWESRSCSERLMKSNWQPPSLESESVCTTFSLRFPTCSPATDLQAAAERIVAQHADLQAAGVRERRGGPVHELGEVVEERRLDVVLRRRLRRRHARQQEQGRQEQDRLLTFAQKRHVTFP